MKRILLFLVFICTAGTLPAHAFEDQAGFQPYPYPPVLSSAIENLPQGFNTILLGSETFYYYHGTFYQKIVRDASYIAVSPPIGAVVFDLPSNYQYMYVDGRAFYVYGGVYYKKVLEGYRVIIPPSGV